MRADMPNGNSGFEEIGPAPYRKLSGADGYLYFHRVHRWLRSGDDGFLRFPRTSYGRSLPTRYVVNKRPSSTAIGFSVASRSYVRSALPPDAGTASNECSRFGRVQGILTLAQNGLKRPCKHHRNLLEVRPCDFLCFALRPVCRPLLRQCRDRPQDAGFVSSSF
jgi:hypothetical protein